MYAVFCMLFTRTTFCHKKTGTRGCFSLDVSASGPDGFQTFRVEGRRRGGELTAIEGCILIGRDERKNIGKPYETMNYRQIRV